MSPDVASFLDRLKERAEIWDRMADLVSAPLAFGDVYRACASELRAELREFDTLPAPPPSVTTTAPPPPDS